MALIEREEIARNFSHREYFARLSKHAVPCLQESRVQASDPEDTALATFCVAMSSNPRTETLTYVQRPRLVGP